MGREKEVERKTHKPECDPELAAGCEVKETRMGGERGGLGRRGDGEG